MLQYIALSVIIIAVIFDPLRDVFTAYQKGWWQRHIVKWIQFYVPVLFIMFVHLDPKWWLILPIPCWIIWQLMLHYVAKAEWESMWIRWFKKYGKIINSK